MPPEAAASPARGTRPAIAISGLAKRFPAPGRGADFVVLDAVDILVEEGSFVSVVGPSGCGKSPILNIIAGIEKADAGNVAVCTKESARDAQPHVGYVFQSPRLLNWLTVEDNIRFVLEAQNVASERWPALVARQLELVGLAGQERNYPLNLSGGMQQRVAIARALAIEPDILLMDEPFSHLDAITARKMRFDLMEILERERTTILFVTHDLSEAVFLSDRIYMMSTRPARIFKRVEIEVPRPRRPDDAALFDIEKALLREFFSVVEARS